MKWLLLFFAVGALSEDVLWAIVNQEKLQQIRANFVTQINNAKLTQDILWQPDSEYIERLEHINQLYMQEALPWADDIEICSAPIHSELVERVRREQQERNAWQEILVAWQEKERQREEQRRQNALGAVMGVCVLIVSLWVLVTKMCF